MQFQAKPGALWAAWSASSGVRKDRGQTLCSGNTEGINLAWLAPPLASLPLQWRTDGSHARRPCGSLGASGPPAAQACAMVRAPSIFPGRGMGWG